MAISSIIKSPLQQELQNVPQEIRHWFGSENVTYLIMDINQKLGLKGEDVRIIPKLLLQIEVRDLRPQYFIQELSSQLNISYNSAKTLAIEIEEKILEPIKQPLLSWEVDINLIKAGHLIGKEEKEMRESEKYKDIDNFQQEKEKVVEEFETEKSIPIEIRNPEPPIRIIGFEEEKKENQPPKVEAPESPLAVSPLVELRTGEAEPMIIHEETEFKPLSESKKSFKSLGGLFRFLKKKKEEEKLCPVRAEIEGIGFSKEISAKGGPANGWKEIIEEFKPIETKIKVVDYTEVPEVKTRNEKLETRNEGLEMRDGGLKIRDDEKREIRMGETEIIKEEKEEAPKISITEAPITESPIEKIVAPETEIKQKGVDFSEEIQRPKKNKFFGGKLFGFFKNKSGLNADISKDIEAGKHEIIEPPIKIITDIKNEKLEMRDEERKI